LIHTKRRYPCHYRLLLLPLKDPLSACLFTPSSPTRGAGNKKLRSLDLWNLGAGDESFEERHHRRDPLPHRVWAAGDRRIAELHHAAFDVVLRHHRERGLGVSLKERRRRSGRRQQEMLGLERDVRKTLLAERRHIRKVDP